jgi:DNA polymerase-3 subunit epsilon
VTLLELAAQQLGSGPRHTLDVAKEVLGLRGHPGAASKAVFALLGRNPRFHVDGEGYWSLKPGFEPLGPSLMRLRYAVVDVETTGGLGGRGDRVTEVAIVHVEGGAIGEWFHTLVNPGRSIPPRIQGFTGITDEMVSVAPYFEGVAEEISARLENRIFVAHNERFDWGMIGRELLASGRDTPEVERLCTVRLGRLLVPRLRSYGLDSLTGHFRIRIEQRHRALGDALATAKLLIQLIAEADSRGISDLSALRDILCRGGIRGRRRRFPPRKGKR